jgi:hypothetical protein
MTRRDLFAAALAAPLVRAVAAKIPIGYAVLETDSAATLEADLRQNLGYIRGL